LERAFPDDRLEVLRIPTISLGATRQLLATNLGLRLPHHLLRRVYNTTLGNPLFALEVGRMLARLDLEALGEDLPVPEAVEDALGLRVADLDPVANRVLLALALDPDLRVDQVRELAGEAALEHAAEAVRIDGDRVRASHPLLAAVAKRAASDDDVRRLHDDLAELVVDRPRGALHLALARTEADEAVAERLDAAVAQAIARGSTRLAVDLATHALRLTPDGAADSDRVMVLARLLFGAGEKRRLTDLLTPRAGSLAEREDRVRAYLLLTGGVVRDNDDILELLQRALDESGDDASLRLRVLCHLAENEAVIEVRNVALADARAREAVAASATGTADDQRLALYTQVWTGALSGRAVADVARQHDDLPGDPTFLARTPDRVVGQRHVWRGEPASARARFDAFRSIAAERAEPSSYALARLHLCELELRTGRWSAAAELLDEWSASADSSLLHWPMYERCRGLLFAGRGDAAAAREWAGRAMAQAEAMGVRWDWLEATRALGLSALLDKDPAESVRHLRTVWDHTRREGVLDPGAFPVAPDFVEGLIECRSYDEARRVVHALAAAAEEQDHMWAGLAARRGAAAIGLAHEWSDHDAEELAAVATAYGELGLAFDEARTWLLLGRAARRSRKWGGARTSLERAVAQFDAMGSPGWSGDARAELDRVGARRPTAAGRLTSTERRTAELAARGLANKEIARTLVVTVSTVEFHLRNTYTKLGIRSRMELGPRLRELDESAP
jgi:DNA-binding CsgD family transcriptional regulator